MNLFFAYALAVCPALHTIIGVLALCGATICIFLGLNYVTDRITENDDFVQFLGYAFKVSIGCTLVLCFLWALVPSQKRLNAMMLNYHAGCVDVRDEYGVPQGDK